MSDSAAKRSYCWLFACLALAGFGLDQASKYGIFGALYEEAIASPRHSAERQIIPGAFQLVTQFSSIKEEGTGLLARLRTFAAGEYLPRVNHGALFGIGGRDDNGRDLNLVFTLVSIVAAVVIVAWSGRPQARGDFWLTLALGLILAGTLGNLFDRLVFAGVRDFLHWYYIVDWPVFNLADCCLVTGAGLLLLQAFLVPAVQAQPALQEPAVAEAK